MSNLQALFNAIIVKPIEEEESTYGSIIVPDMGKEKTIKGEVVSIGRGHFTTNGTFIGTILQPGDVVYLPQMGPIKIQHEGQDYLTCRENEVLGVITDRHLNYLTEESEELPF